MDSKTPSQMASLVATTPEQRAREVENAAAADARLERLRQRNLILDAMNTSMAATTELHASRLGRRARSEGSLFPYRDADWAEGEAQNTISRYHYAIERAAYYLLRLYEAV